LKNVLVVPNGVDAAPRPPNRSRVGAAEARIRWQHELPPNRDAVVWFARQVIPIIEESVSDVAFDVIGPNAAPDLISELPGRVTFRGFIDDLRDALGHYDVSVAPIHFGGGTKLKVLEALSMGLPIVTTPVGAEGLGLNSGTHALIASSPEDFARSVVALFRDPVLAQSISRQGGDLIRSRFLWSAIRDRLADWLITAH
jgi:glycosyltransferase involved in cell wall biosynthesis